MKWMAAIGATVVLSMAFTANAGAAIEPQVGIAGIELEMTGDEVIAEKGEPDADKLITNELLGEVRKMRYGKTKAFLFADTDSVYVVQTRNPRQRTDGGAGIGSKEERILDVVPDVRCRTETGFHSCFVGRRRPGNILTSFLFSNRTDRVARVVVGFVID